MRDWLRLVLLLGPLTAWADWRAGGMDGYLEFVPVYEGVELPGRFRDFDVRLQTKNGTPAGGKLEVVVRVASADLLDADLNEGIAGRDFFDFTQFPEARFSSSSITAPPDGNGFMATGQLALKGHIHEVTVPFHWKVAPGQADMRGALELSRGAFGIGEGEWATSDAIADRVEVRFELRLHEAP